MRKKYLSALLFGALLFASAGTFTSCKDYDDDIDNLSQRIDQVASDLNDLKTKVDALGGYVENVSFADGVLSVTTGGNTVTYNIPDKTGVNEVTLALDGNNLVLTVDGEAQTIALPAGETGEVEIPEIEVKDGVLYINGEPQTLKVDVESNVTVIESTIPGNETYTVMVNGEEVTFAKAFADVRISLITKNNGSDFYFTDAKFANENKTAVSQNGTPSGKQENGIHWTILSQDVKWDGPKGDLKAGLVVGQVTAAEVSVRPINYDLTTAKLTLVSSKGEVAPVTVIPTKGQKEGPLSNGTRSADVNYSGVDQGDYVLSLVFDKFTAGKEAEEIISKFANATQTGNIKYALAVDGVVATDYNFIIDTQLKADAQSSCETPDGSKLVIGGEGEWDSTNEVLTNVPANDLFHRMTYLDGRIYDMKVAINAKDVNDAEVYGVEISEDGTSIKAGQNAVGRKFALDVTLIDVNGNVSTTKTIEIKFAEADKQEVTLSPVTHDVTPAADKSVLVDLGDVFSSLSASDAIAVNSIENITWAIENDDTHFLWPLDGTNSFSSLNGDAAKILYFDENMKGIDVSDDKIDENIKKIRYAKLVWNGDNYANKEAQDGEHLISITINRVISASDDDDATRLVKKVNIPVHVVVPAWEDLFKTTSMWSDGVFKTRLTGVDESTKEVYASMDAFEDVKNDWGGKLNDNIKLEELTYENATGREATILASGVTSVDNVGVSNAQLSWDTLTDAIEANNHVMPDAFRNLSAKVSYTIGGVKDFKIEEDFTVYLMSIFEGADLTYYTDKGAKADAVMGADDVIKMATVSTDDTEAKNGVAIEFNGYKGEVSGLILAGGTNVQTLTADNNGNTFKISYDDTNKPSDAYTIYINKYTAQATSLTGADIDKTNGTGLKVIPATGVTGIIENGSTGSIMFQFVDVMGVYTQDVLNFKKEAK
ncbi:hypothetical protein Bacsa_2323 [Phocaeicola salanitronis DSM 18170]|uniref:DUF4988 domain-containing protein n=1 Tax=Phocaeicola salanitronis (strain DSM 18170 / JCM 13657 / CCUG 60908 / BL78) TaxID=667015 RepID=F0R6I3_PHOSB|nr:hypothetical protein [Phocaeicola salanitronis]ADY36871.1 hypothetical protein Bacsa_2323 [Phocaeicola salanitronis DSM 18170]